MSPDRDLVAAGTVLAAHGLVDAFGHVSSRIEDEPRMRITPAVPLGTVGSEASLLDVGLDVSELPTGVPREAWVHVAIYRRRADVQAICRAQPSEVASVAGAGLTITALHGQGAFIGAVVVQHDDARLVRSADAAEAVAASLGDGWAVVMRGNGAITVGQSVGEAVARMYVLEASAAINRAAAQIGSRSPLSDEEVRSWQDVAPEILGRLWSHLRDQSNAGS